VATGSSDPHSIVDGLLVESLNEVIDLHQKRVTVGRLRIPERIGDVLVGLTALSMIAMGFDAADCGEQSSCASTTFAIANEP
jgi:hypothetical protein